MKNVLYESVELTFLLSSQIHHFLDFVKQIYKDLPKVVVSSGCIVDYFSYVFGSYLIFWHFFTLPASSYC